MFPRAPPALMSSNFCSIPSILITKNGSRLTLKIFTLAPRYLLNATNPCLTTISTFSSTTTRFTSESKNACMVRIEKCMYGLPQAGRLSQLRLIEHLRKHGYIQSSNTPCLFRHLTHDIQFCLVVDNFGIKYGSRDDADHLIHTLQSNGYELTIKGKGDTCYLGMDIKFTPRTISIFMSGYIEKMLQRFRPSYLLPSHRPSHTPGKYTTPVYRRIQQYVEIDDSPTLSPSQTKELQAIVGPLLYYARAVDPTLLPIANELASQQATPTTKALTAANRALSYY
jgi:hypothetical protein